MSGHPLIDRQIKQAKPSAKEYLLFDSVARGLAVRILPTGTKSLCFLYRNLAGKNVRETLGRYPDLSLADAREMVRKMRSELANGIDPRLKKMQELDAHKSGNVTKVLDEHLYVLKKNNKSGPQSERILRKLLEPYDQFNIGDLRKEQTRSIIKGVATKSGLSSANHAFTEMRRFFRWAVGQGYLQHSPCEGMPLPYKLAARSRVLKNGELKAIWAAAERMEYPFGPFVKCLILTGQRRNEVARLTWDDCDLDKKLWAQPTTANKAKREHLVPLSDQVVKILEAVPRLAQKFIFPARGKQTAMSGFSKWKRKLDKLSGVTDWTLHDFRRTISTGMASELKTPLHVAELTLNHSSKATSGVAGVYNKYGYLDEKRQALQAWADYVTRLVEDRSMKNVAETEKLSPDADQELAA